MAIDFVIRNSYHQRFVVINAFSYGLYCFLTSINIIAIDNLFCSILQPYFYISCKIKPFPNKAFLIFKKIPKDTSF